MNIISPRIALLAGLCALAPASAMAQSYPLKPVRIIIPFPAGSGPDLITRTMGSHITEALGQAVVVENKGGGAVCLRSWTW
jgi:tripartite-type tricarboxylate transporter receptor subunit TctC